MCGDFILTLVYNAGSEKGENMSQNMNGFPGLREAAALSAALVLTMTSCTEREGPTPVPTIESSTEQADPQNICDITTRDRVANFLAIASDNLVEGKCVSDKDNGITAHKTWYVDGGAFEGLQIASFTTDETTAGPGGFSFANLYRTVPKSQQCTTPVDIKVNECVVTDDAAGVLVDDKAVFTQLGYRKKFAPLSAQTRLSESFGDQLIAFSAASAETLVQSPQSQTASKQPSPADLSATFRPDNVNPKTPPLLAANYNYAPCSFYDDGPSACASLDPNIETGFVNYTDTTGCTFEGTINYGDGNVQTYSTAGTTPGHTKLQDHRYSKPGNYSVSLTATAASGGCTVNSRGVEFTFTMQHQPTPATCANRLDQDRGRAYLYSMLPSGTLARANGVSDTEPYIYDKGTPDNNRYVDAAGVTWYLLPEDKSKYSQPAGWDPVKNEGEVAYYKFVSEKDSSWGSYDAVLMPDGATATTNFEQLSGKVLTYNQNNWKLYGNGMPTYNLNAPMPGDTLMSTDNVPHLVSDVFPHDFGPGSNLGDGRYVAPDTRHIINPATADWRTYRQRMFTMQGLIDSGYRLNPQNNNLELGGVSQPVGQDLLWAAKIMIDCAN
jgi:hypothetical protein